MAQERPAPGGKPPMPGGDHPALQKSKAQQKTMQKAGLLIALANILMAAQMTMSQNYANYAYTDLNGIDAGTMALCMSVVNVIAICITLVSGGIIQRTHFRAGKFRPWILIGSAVQAFGSCMLFFSYPSTLSACVFLSAGYLLANSSMDFIFSARNGLYQTMSGIDSEARTFYVARETQGKTIGSLIVSAIVVSLIIFFTSVVGGGSGGYLVTQIIFSVVIMAGAVIFYIIGKPYDKPLPKGAPKPAAPQNQASILEMVKGVLANRAAVMLILGDLCRLGGLYVFMGTIIYVCVGVYHDMQYMTIILILTSVAGFLGALCGPKFTHLIGGRKKTIIIFSALTGICYFGVSIFGGSVVGFAAASFVANFFGGVVNTIDVPMYMDAGEYWLQKKGKDTRVFIISMFNVAMKCGIALSSLLIAWILSTSCVTDTASMTASQGSTFVLVLGITLAVLNLLPVLFMLFYPVKDDEIQGIIIENAEKYGNMAGGPGGPGPEGPGEAGPGVPAPEGARGDLGAGGPGPKDRPPRG